MRDLDLEHPGVTCAQRTGYGTAPRPVTLGGVDLKELAEDNVSDFIAWVLAGEPDALERFAEEHPWLWREYG